MLPAVRCALCVVCRVLLVVGKCSMRGVYCLLFGVCCLLFGVRCSLIAGRCVVSVVWFTGCVCSSLFAVGLPVVC